MRGKLITLLARLGKGSKYRPPVLNHARMQRDGSVEVHGDGFAVRYCDPDEPFPSALVPLDWLAKIGKQAGGRGHASFEADVRYVPVDLPQPPRTIARIKSGTYGVDGAWDEEFPKSQAPTGTPVELRVADWSAGGAVPFVLPTASTDGTRESIHGVYLGLVVAATNGYQLSRREACAFMPGLSGVLPLEAVDAMLRLVAETAPTSLVAHVGEGTELDGRKVAFTATCAHGVTWTLTSRLVDGFPSCDAVVAAAEGGETLVDVDAADLRELWHPLRHSRSWELAVYKDGNMLVWGDDGAGIGTTLSAIPTERPALILGSSTLPNVAKKLPKSGRVTLRAGTDYSCMILGEIVMQTRYERLPEHVTLALEVAFG